MNALSRRVAVPITALLLAGAGACASAGQGRPRAPESAPKAETLDGYAELRTGEFLVVDGQRVTLGPGGKFKGEGDALSFATIPLGYEVKARGPRRPNGLIVADQIEAKPNSVALFEDELREGFDEMERQFLREGRMYEEDEGSGKREDYGRLWTDGARVDRVRRILRRLVPGYLKPEDFRIYVVENKEWNAMAAPNRSLYVFSGLLDDMNDDEVAIVIGHEVAHATHEHSRKQFKKDMLIQLAALGVAVIADETIKSEGKATAVQVVALIAATAWQSGYGRTHEDQADRVGLRYAYEGGFDPSQGPRLWERFAKKYGDVPKIINFFLGDHSVAKDRGRNLSRELALNYAY